MNRKDISEIPCLLKEFDAEGYGLFYTGLFTAQTLDRLKRIGSDHGIEVQYWDNFELTRTIRKSDNIMRNYLELTRDK